MTRWARGEADIERLIAAGDLQQVRGAQANGEPWLDKAQRTLRTAEKIHAADPTSAYTLAYDAVRFACTALLVQQGLRPTTSGGHYAIEQSVRAQFGDHFKKYGLLRRRRNELEYPTYPDEEVEPGEAQAATQDGREIIDNAARLLPNLGLF